MFERTENDKAMDKVLGGIQDKRERKKKRRKQGEDYVESLLSERRQEQEDSISTHIIIGGSLLVFLCSTVVFTLAKSAGITLMYCFAFSIGILVLGNIPFALIWIIKNKDFTITLLLIIPNVILSCCSMCTAAWYCFFWCTPWEGGCKRTIDSILCCLCQRGLCLGWTPSCFLCEECHSSCFTSQQKRRREASRRRRRISITQYDDGSVEMKEITGDEEGSVSGRVKETSLDERDMEAIRNSLSIDRESFSLKKEKSSPRFSLRGVSSPPPSGKRRKSIAHETSPVAKTSAWNTMFSRGNESYEKVIELQDLSSLKIEYNTKESDE